MSSGLARVFISYASDDGAHEEAVRRLWVLLRSVGVDAVLDVVAAQRPQDWEAWAREQVRSSDFVLVVASPAFKERAEGVDAPAPGEGWRAGSEAALIRNEAHGDQKAALAKFLPVVLPGRSPSDIPAWLLPNIRTFYRVHDFTVTGIEPLFRYLTGQPAVVAPPLGAVPVLPPRGFGEPSAPLGGPVPPTAPSPPPGEPEAGTPDLVVTVHRPETGTGGYVWSARPASAGLTGVDAVPGKDLAGQAGVFARDTRRMLTSAPDAEATYRWLVGRGLEIADAIPEPVRDVLVRLVEDPTRSTPATVLLLTDEVHIPWELAVLRVRGADGAPRDLAGPGGSSPFLGSHVAIGRWVLANNVRQALPEDEVVMSRAAVLTARYEGMVTASRWGRLPEAEKEASDLLSVLAPAASVPPVFADVMRLLEGEPGGEVIHAALHGQVDPDGVDEGLVLLRTTTSGLLAPQYLQAEHVRSVHRIPGRPLVFLNACQVGAGKQVLGDYAGLAAALLSAGARAVVAPLWNVADGVASDVARDFYTTTLTDGVTVAEALRRTRARYAADAFTTGQPGPHATLLAYQLFGHPALRLHRPTTTGTRTGAGSGA